MADGGTVETQMEISDEEEREVEKMESDVSEMATKIAEYRDTLPNQLTSALASLLTAQRPILSTSLDVGSGHGDTGRRAELGASSVQAEEDKEYAEKIQLLKQKLSSNASAMPNVLKRMKECISRIAKLDSCNGVIHPAFQRKRICVLGDSPKIAAPKQKSKALDVL